MQSTVSHILAKMSLYFQEAAAGPGNGTAMVLTWRRSFDLSASRRPNLGGQTKSRHHVLIS